jgi:hypothetical protein
MQLTTLTKDTDAAVRAEVNDDDDSRFVVRTASGGMAEVELGNKYINKN